MSEIHPRATAFDGAAEAYERGRPDWPVAALGAAAARLGLGADAVVADLAAGTGKLTRALAARWANVVAIEPLDGMRAVLARALPDVRALAGRAEAIPLADGSVDAVFVGEAFHWFDAPRAAAELARVVRAGGGVAVLYNRAPWGEAPEPWLREVSDLLDGLKVRGDGVDPEATRPWHDALEAAVGPLAADTFDHVQSMSAEDFVALIASFSWMAAMPDDGRTAALDRIRAVLARHGIETARIEYRTELTTARRCR